MRFVGVFEREGVFAVDVRVLIEEKRTSPIV
jgi:hypothetical protein